MDEDDDEDDDDADAGLVPDVISFIFFLQSLMKTRSEWFIQLS